MPPASDSHVRPFAYNNCSGPLSTDSNGQIRCLIRPSLIGPWTRLIGVPTTELPALIYPHESPSHCQSTQLPLDIVNDYYWVCTIVLVYLSPSNGHGVKVSQVPLLCCSCMFSSLTFVLARHSLVGCAAIVTPDEVG